MNSKIISYQDISLISQKIKDNSKTIVLVTGVFDLLHSAHRQFLQKAKKTADYLFVGIEPDLRVKKLKGKDRPIQNEKLRQKNISNLKFIDYTFILPENFSSEKSHKELINLLKPDILAVSSHTPFLETKKNILKNYNTTLKIVMKKDKSISTSQIIKNNS